MEEKTTDLPFPLQLLNVLHNAVVVICLTEQRRHKPGNFSLEKLCKSDLSRFYGNLPDVSEHHIEFPDGYTVTAAFFQQFVLPVSRLIPTT